MSTVQARRWTRQEYDRMVEAGVFTPEDRLELVAGEVLAMTPQGSPHATSVSLVAEALRLGCAGKVHVRVQLPLALGSDSEPEPDVAVVAGSIRDYAEAHPQSALLVVEVADATLVYDRDTKGSLYARAMVPEYWLVNLVERVVEVYRDPVAAAKARFGWSYRTVQRVSPDGSMTPPASLTGSIAVADLL